MVAESISLPNIRKMFLPDEGYTIIDADLKKADLQIVTWEANDENLKQIFREGLDPYMEGAKEIYNVAQPSKEQYKKVKAGVHLTDIWEGYGFSYHFEYPNLYYLHKVKHYNQ